MFDNDIKWLYNNVPLHTPVNIINQPFKISLEPDLSMLIEVHQPLTVDEGHSAEPWQQLEQINSVIQKLGMKNTDFELLKPYLKNPTGIVYSLPR